MILLVSPAEPPAIRKIGTTSSTPELYGVDVMWPTPYGVWGIQRKAMSDLIASLSDGRLHKEIGQMAYLQQAVLLVEAEGKWTSAGEWVSPWGRGIARSQYRRLLYTVRQNGVWVEHSDSLADTLVVIQDLVEWSEKDSHKSLKSRPGSTGSAWGRVTNRDYALHLLTSLPGVGAELAERILDTFGGVPMRWEVTAEQLQTVPGLGPKKAQRLLAALAGGATPTPGSASSVGNAGDAASGKVGSNGPRSITAER